MREIGCGNNCSCIEFPPGAQCDYYTLRFDLRLKANKIYALAPYELCSIRRIEGIGFITS